VAQESGLAMKFAAVSLVGFGVDALLLHVGVGAGLEPAWARLISLFCAMQATFILNRLLVFRGHDRASLLRQWATYMTAGGFGNFCNYWIFVTLVSTHWPLISNHLFALAVGSFTAWVINYLGCRFVVFRRAKPPSVGAVLTISVKKAM
jgi:putative flippase GtrA